MVALPTCAEEEALWREGLRLVAGVDEAGRGCLAGPVAAAAVVLPPWPSFPWLDLVRDSKELAPPLRAELARLIRRDALAAAVAFVSHRSIDAMGIHRASRLAMERAVRKLRPSPQFLLIDGLLRLEGTPLPQKAIVDGDCLSISIACASIIAKVARDELMARLDNLYAGYGLARHKGYPTPEHRAALARLGPSPIHRRSFSPVRQALEERAQD